MAIGVRVKYSGSWLDPNCAGLLGWKLGQKLWRRCRGEVGLFLTLTYRRDEYASGQELYYRQQERQDVPLFMRRLSRALGVSLKGKWLCKAEWQSGGWIHFHLVILGQSFIDHALLERCWGHGFVWVKRLSKKNCLYLTKYVAKGGRIPLWLYGEAPKTVKIIRVSPGFWRRPGDPVPQEKKPAEVVLWSDGTPVRGAKVHGCYVPIGIRLRQRGVLLDFNGKIFSRRCEPSCFMLQCLRYAQRVWQADGWIWYEIPSRGVEWILG
ncbi:MAG TPA: hypothetical protein VFW73_01700, partial [Lacipirellulaceae bacterium]|nr:hypothetical protein [Lacipirellulaceae bacterium]